MTDPVDRLRWIQGLQSLFGARYQSDAAIALSLNRKTIMRKENGEAPVTAEDLDNLVALMLQKWQSDGHLIQDLRARRAAHAQNGHREGKS